MHLLRSLTIIVINRSEYSLMSFVLILLLREVFLRLFLISLNYKGVCHFLETKIRLLYIIRMIFDGHNTRMMFVLFDDQCQRICIKCNNFTHVICIDSSIVDEVIRTILFF